MRARRTGWLVAAALAVTAGGCSLAGGDSPSSGSSPASSTTAAKGELVTTHEQPPEGRDWVVLVEDPAQTDRVAGELEDADLPLTSVNRGIGMVTLRSTDDDVQEVAEDVEGVARAVTDTSAGWSPDEDADPSPSETGPASSAPQPPRPPESGDPFDGWLWGMAEIKASAAHEVTTGSPDVRVGVIDTGVDAGHPDLAERVDAEDSRSFVTDIPGLDGPCEHERCLDPVGSDDHGHGTHVAGIVAASANGLGVQGVAPDVRLVDLRAGQDSGYFFLGPVANAITVGAELELDVLNMSFYVDPWLQPCPGGAPEDSPAEAAAQDVTIELMHRALDLAHERGVTLVSAAGNNAIDLADPGLDLSSPNYGAESHERTIADDCEVLPLGGPHVLGVSSVDEDGARSSFSNYTSDPDSDQVAVAAPGGVGSDSGRPILSTASRSMLVAKGEVDEQGRVTTAGAERALVRDCPEGIGEGEPDPQERCGYYEWLMGTSMAAPHASGVAALVISAGGGDVAPVEVLDRLRSSAQDQPCPGLEESASGVSPVCTGSEERNGFFGDGVLDAEAAVS